MVKSTNQVVEEFETAVNMAPQELEDWLETEESQHVGWNPEGGEAVGHTSGRHIVDILRTKERQGEGAAEHFSKNDVDHMRRVVSYVHRHLAQRHRMKDTSDDSISHSKWRYSLMNWGHDPLKE
jgi:hypothetical protein